MPGSLLQLPHELSTLLREAHAASGDQRVRIAAEKVAALATADRAAVSPQSQAAVERWLPPTCRHASDATRPVVDIVERHAAELSWFVPYGHVVGDPLIDDLRAGYAVALLAGPSDESWGASPFISEDLMVAITVQGPGLRYPEHYHSAIEIYSPIAGTAEWFSDSRGWRLERPGAVIAHGEDEIHAITTLEAPLLTYVVWITDPSADAHLAPRAG